MDVIYRLCVAKNELSRKINSLGREPTDLTRPMVL